MPPTTPRSPRSGERIRAVADDREGRSVEGILYLRQVPSPLYVQVFVVVDGGSWLVAPDSIEVLVPEEVAVEDLERDDPLVGQPGRRRIADLAEAAKAGLLPESIRMGGTWDDLFAELASGRDRRSTLAGESSTPCRRRAGSTATRCSTTSNGEVVELEYYEHGQLVAYPVLEEPPEGDVKPFFSVHGSTPESALHAFRNFGWL